MNLRFVSPSAHGVLDYLLDASLVVVPFVAGFTGFALWLSVAVGFTNMTYSFLTSYRGGLVALLPFRIHLLVDLALGILLVAAALLAGFAGFVLVFYLFAGVGIALVVAVTEPEEKLRSGSAPLSA